MILLAGICELYVYRYFEGNSLSFGHTISVYCFRYIWGSRQGKCMIIQLLLFCLWFWENSDIRHFENKLCNDEWFLNALKKIILAWNFWVLHSYYTYQIYNGPCHITIGPYLTSNPLRTYLLEHDMGPTHHIHQASPSIGPCSTVIQTHKQMQKSLR